MALISNDPPRPLSRRVLYRSVQWLTLIAFKIFFRFRYRHADRLRLTGGALICPNHVSHLDPMAVGCIAPRRVSFLAKRDLFQPPMFGKLLGALECIAIDRDTTGISGMKETLKKLKQGESVVLFPEGERSSDGEMIPLKTGFTALVRRVKIPIVPVGIHGTYEAWPRGKSRPRMGRIRIFVGEPIPFSRFESMSEAEMVDFVAQRIDECRREAAELP